MYAKRISDPFQTLKRIIDEWWDLELDERDPSWMLSPVNSARKWSSTNDFNSPAYVLTRKGNPFHILRPHGVLGSGMGAPTVDSRHCSPEADQ